MQIQFFGAAGTVTGSSYLLKTASSQTVLIDLGMFQDKRIEDLNAEPLGFDSRQLSGVFVSHAHLDHCGRLPLLCKSGYTGNIYMTEATAQLVKIALTDAVKVAHEHTERIPLYSEDDVTRVFQQIVPVQYGQKVTIEKFQATFKNAGHILGSASIEITDGEKTILFSGDIGNPQQKLLQPAEKLSPADVVVMESTYGDRIHPVEDTIEIIEKEVNMIEKNGGVLLLPAFALDRTQVLLHILNHLKRDRRIRTETPVFLDSPMAIKATQVYEQARDLWSDELRSHQDNPFSFAGLTITHDAKDSEKIITVSGPKVIIAGNGMMTGGRIWHHLINYLPLSTTRLLIVGYQGEGTLGRDILNGEQNLHIYHETIPLRATVTQAEGFSAHADEKELLAWFLQIAGVQKIFLTHGEDTARQTLSTSISQKVPTSSVIMPQKGEIFSL